MALNMLLCRVWAELTRTLKKSKLRRKPNTTEVAVNPERGREKNNSSEYNIAVLMLVLRLAMDFRWHYWAKTCV